VHQFSLLFNETIDIMDNGGLGLTDCLGEFFQQHITKGRNGQFFTPPTVTDFMSAIVMDTGTNGNNIFDPACGSGRMLLSGAKIARNNFFFGADIDNRCCKMTAINLCLNGLIGEVAWMNTLSQEHWGGFEIYYDESRMFVPTIKKLKASEGLLANKRINNSVEEKTDKPFLNETQLKMDF
jgi:hypothetical protein